MSPLEYSKMCTEKQDEVSVVEWQGYQSLEKEILQLSEAIRKYSCHLP